MSSERLISTPPKPRPLVLRFHRAQPHSAFASLQATRPRGPSRRLPAGQRQAAGRRAAGRAKAAGWPLARGRAAGAAAGL